MIVFFIYFVKNFLAYFFIKVAGEKKVRFRHNKPEISHFSVSAKRFQPSD